MSKLPPSGKHIKLSKNLNRYVVFKTERPAGARKDRTVIIAETRYHGEAGRIAEREGLL